MKNTDLLSAIGKIDEKYIKIKENAYATVEKREKKTDAGRIIKKILSVAAVVVIIGGLWVVSFIAAQNRQDPNSAASTGEDLFDESETSYEENTTNTVETDPQDTEFTKTSELTYTELKDAGYPYITSALYLCSKQGAGVYHGYDLAFSEYINGAYIGAFAGNDTKVWIEKVAGLDFVHENSNQFIILSKNGTVCEGLNAAYEQGLITEDHIDLFYERYTGSVAASQYTSLVKTNEFSVNFGDGEGEIAHIGNIDDPEKAPVNIFVDNGDICIADLPHRRINRYDENGNFKGVFSLKNSDTESISSCVILNNAYYTVEDDNRIYRYKEEDKPELFYERKNDDIMHLFASTECRCNYVYLRVNINTYIVTYRLYEDGINKDVVNINSINLNMEHLINKGRSADYSFNYLIHLNPHPRVITERRYYSEPESKSHLYLYWADGYEIASYVNGDENDIYAGLRYAFDNDNIYSLNVNEDGITVVQITIKESR